MKNGMNWKLFWVLLVTCLITVLMALPYTIALNPVVMKIPVWILTAVQLIQSAILFSIAIYCGLKMGKKVGLGLPILEKALKGDEYKTQLKSILGSSVKSGVAVAILIILSGAMFLVSVTMLKAEMSVAMWKAILVSFYGGIAEEVMMRLFLMTFLVWIAAKLSKGKVTTTGMWAAIIVSAIIFGLGHLPITAGMTLITPMVVMRAIVLNGIGGTVFGWLYQKNGLESAMISHFSADVVLHVIFPLVLSTVV